MRLVARMSLAASVLVVGCLTACTAGPSGPETAADLQLLEVQPADYEVCGRVDGYEHAVFGAAIVSNGSSQEVRIVSVTAPESKNLSIVQPMVLPLPDGGLVLLESYPPETDGVVNWDNAKPAARAVIPIGEENYQIAIEYELTEGEREASMGSVTIVYRDETDKLYELRTDAKMLLTDAAC